MTLVWRHLCGATLITTIVTSIISILITAFTMPHSASAYVVPTGTLTCFSRPLGDETKECQMIHGFRSCYTKYNMRGQVMARGCSTLQPNFNKCDTNKYGQFKSDKYCYCKKSYCNHSTHCLPNLYCLVFLYSMYLIYSHKLTDVHLNYGQLRPR